MIYLIRSSAYKNRADKACTEFETILKIGYTKEDGIKSRTDAYLTENPTCQVIALIPDGDMQDESNLHWYFREYKKPYGNEWFEEVQEIYEFFQVNDTIEKIRSIVPIHIYRSHITRDLKIMVRSWILAIQDVTGIKVDETRLYHECDTDEDIIRWVCKEYPDLAGSIVQAWESNDDKKEIISFLQDTTVAFTVRLKTLCESSFSEEERYEIARQASDSFDRFYNILGPSECKRLGYNITRMENEIRNILITKDDDLIQKELLRCFNPGDRDTKANIKTRVGKIYDSLGIKKVAKASDLGQYFYLKEIRIIDPLTKKVSAGFEIIGIK